MCGLRPDHRRSRGGGGPEVLETWWCAAAICPLPNRTSCTAGCSDDGQEVAAVWRICDVPLGDMLASLLGGQQSCAPCWERSFARLMGDSLASLLGRPATLSSLLGAQLGDLLASLLGGQRSCAPCWELSFARLMGDSLASLFGRSAKLSSLLGAQLRQTLECSAGLHLGGQRRWASL